jgi:serine/threonine-protein kinase
MKPAALILVALAITITATDADARRRHHRGHHGLRGAPVMLAIPPDANAFRDGRERGAREDSGRLVPSSWLLQPASPTWKGRRYLSPDGNAWLALYSTNAGNDAAERFKAVAFGEGEQITYLRGERDRLTVSGLKGDRIFYRKVMLACGGTVWRHVAIEYPADERRGFDRVVDRMSGSFERIADDACGDSVFTHPQPASDQQPAAQPPAAKPEEKPASPPI